ncbi:MAG TPA: hypothetical protein VND68_14565 [Chloroflexia bacterium]|jgi:hypothetical protein|nr:hypothetical protein [Chloroflexia bacterium]
MFDWQGDMAMQRQHDMLLEAKQYRLVTEATAGMARQPGWTSRLLCRLGTSLVSAGRWLQSRSGMASAPSGSLVFLARHDATGPTRGGIESLRRVA